MSQGFQKGTGMQASFFRDGKRCLSLIQELLFDGLWHGHALSSCSIIPVLGPTAMQAVLEVPDDPVSALKAQFPKYGEQHRIQWDDCSVIHIVAHLPTNAPRGLQCADALAYNMALLLNVIVEMNSLLVFLAEVVGGRGDDKLKGSVGDGLQKLRQSPPNSTIRLSRSKLSAIWAFSNICGELLIQDLLPTRKIQATWLPFRNRTTIAHHLCPLPRPEECSSCQETGAPLYVALHHSAPRSQSRVCPVRSHDADSGPPSRLLPQAHS